MRERFQIHRALDSTAADDVNQQKNDGDDKEDVKQSAQRILCHHAEEPEDDEK